MPTLRLAFRSLFKAPIVTGVAILSLALGLGANAAIFSIYDQMLLRALPVPEPGRLARSLLYELESHDPMVLVLAAAALSLAALRAGLVPARRAARGDPMCALRYE